MAARGSTADGCGTVAVFLDREWNDGFSLTVSDATARKRVTVASRRFGVESRGTGGPGGPPPG